MRGLSARDDQDSVGDELNRAAYGKERVVVTRRGKALAAIVPIEDMKTPGCTGGRARCTHGRKAPGRLAPRRTQEEVVKKHRAKP